MMKPDLWPELFLEINIVMDTALGELIRISNAVGKDKTLVLGNFGNTSVKSDDGTSMVIKASGTELAAMNTENGWRRVRVADVLALLNDKGLAKLERR